MNAVVSRRAHGVRGERKCDHPRAFGQLPGEVVEVEGRVLVDLDEADSEVEVLGELEPGRDVPVVVEARDEDLVACCERSSERAGQGEVERRHVLAEHRLAGPAAEEARGGCVRPLDELVAAAAGRERRAEVRVRLAQVGGDGVDHRLGALRAAGRRPGTRRPRRAPGSEPGPPGGRGSSLLQRRHRQAVLPQLLPVQLGLLLEAGPDDGPPGVVDPVRQPHPAVVREAGDDRREGERDALETCCGRR